MKLKQEGTQFELLEDIIHLIVKSCVDQKLLEKHELVHVKQDYQTKKYRLDQMHVSLVNASWGQRDLLKIHGKQVFIGKEIIENDLGKLQFEDFTAKSLEISTRFKYSEETGMYLS